MVSYIVGYSYGIIQVVPSLEQVFLLTYLFITLIYLGDIKLFDDILIRYHHLIPILIIFIRIYFTIWTFLSYNLFLFSNLAISFEDSYILMMNPGNDQGGYGGNLGGGPSGSNNSGGSGGPGGPEGLGNTYPAVSNHGNSNEPEQAPNLTTTAYNPAGTVPPSNYQELYSLMEHRVEYQTNFRRVTNVTVTMIFSKDDIINKIAKEMLFAYIFDHKEEVPTAYRKLNLPNGNP